MDELDKQITKIFKTTINKPSSYNETIKNALYKKNNAKHIFNNFNIYKAILSTVCMAVLMTGVVFSKEIYSIAKKLFASLNKGVETAIDNDYI